MNPAPSGATSSKYAPRRGCVPRSSDGRGWPQVFSCIQFGMDDCGKWRLNVQIGLQVKIDAYNSVAKLFCLVVVALTVFNPNSVCANGTVVAWGYDYEGQTNVPVGLSNVTVISSEDATSLALSNGTVTAWGSFSVTGMTNAVTVAGGGLFCLALRSDGTMAVSGTYSGPGPDLQEPEPAMPIPTGLSNIVSIAAGHDHGLAVRADGTVIAWGNNNYDQTNVPAGLSNVVMVAGGYGHSVALCADGTIAAWGNNAQGETNVPAGLSNVVAIAAGYDHNLALKADGTVVGWGLNDAGDISIPFGLSNVVAIACGAYHSLALRSDGTVVAWGINTYGETSVPVGLSNVVAIAAGDAHSMALVNNTPTTTQPSLTNLVRGDGIFSLSLPTQNGRVYALEFKNSLMDNAWTASPLIAGNGSSQTLTDLTATNSQRFYRVRQW